MAERKNLQSPVHKDAITIIKRLFSGGEIIPDQVPRAVHWSPEKELAAAVLVEFWITESETCSPPRPRRSPRSSSVGQSA